MLRVGFPKAHPGLPESPPGVALCQNREHGQEENILSAERCRASAHGDDEQQDDSRRQ